MFAVSLPPSLFAALRACLLDSCVFFSLALCLLSSIHVRLLAWLLASFLLPHLMTCNGSVTCSFPAFCLVPSSLGYHYIHFHEYMFAYWSASFLNCLFDQWWLACFGYVLVTLLAFLLFSLLGCFYVYLHKCMFGCCSVPCLIGYLFTWWLACLGTVWIFLVACLLCLMLCCFYISLCEYMSTF